MDVYELMLACLHAEDASRRQVQAIIGWRELVQQAVDAARPFLPDLPSPLAAGLAITGVRDTSTHLRWADATRKIIDALQRQVRTAQERYEHHRAAAAAAAAAAAEAADEAAAATTTAEAEAAAAEVMEAESMRAYHAEMMRLAMIWMQAAEVAASFGTGLLATEDGIARPIAAAIQAAGGLAEVASSKRYHVRGGGR
jgi:regulator of protease activity HflC (stomatin/prohibitin superfamily)